jgi:uncharacterized membrane protein YoaK (UPF0700 family)
MELGKLLYWNARGTAPAHVVRHEVARMKRTAGLILMFVLGGVAGALGFKYVGFVCVVPLAALLLALSVPPLIREVPPLNRLGRVLRMLRKWQAPGR